MIEGRELFIELESLLRRQYYGWEGVEQFNGTGERLSRAFEELCWTNEKIASELETCFDAVFVDGYDELLVEGPIVVWTLCPHHLLPCRFTVYIGYVPDEEVLGLSKFARVTIILGKRPVMQETYSRELADIIVERLRPKGVGVYVVGEHGCMQARGVGQSTGVTTSVLKGVIKDRPEVRAEFLAIVHERSRR